MEHIFPVQYSFLIPLAPLLGAIVIARRNVVGEAGPVTSETLVAPMTPIDDDPHSIPVVGTRNPRQKEYPET